MRLLTASAKHWPALLVSGLALGALALLWRVRDTPLALGAFARFDAAELKFCRYLNRSSRRLGLRQLFRTASWLGDGWVCWNTS